MVLQLSVVRRCNKELFFLLPRVWYSPKQHRTQCWRLCVNKPHHYSSLARLLVILVYTARFDLIQSLVPPHYVCNWNISIVTSYSSEKCSKTLISGFIFYCRFNCLGLLLIEISGFIQCLINTPKGFHLAAM
jgi:hypothetical protein